MLSKLDLLLAPSFLADQVSSSSFFFVLLHFVVLLLSDALVTSFILIFLCGKLSCFHLFFSWFHLLFVCLIKGSVPTNTQPTTQTTYFFKRWTITATTPTKPQRHFVSQRLHFYGEHSESENKVIFFFDVKSDLFFFFFLTSRRWFVLWKLIALFLRN